MPERNRRQHERHSTTGKAAVVLLNKFTGETQVLQGEVRDLSQGGACVVLAKPLNVGDFGVVQLAMGAMRKLVGFEVRSVRYESGVGNIMGVRFWTEAPNTAYEKLLEGLREAMEKRAA